MATYSHSQLESFLQCKLKYKFKYIDKIKVQLPRSIELFMGDIVHQSLKYLYDGVIKKTIFPVQFVIAKYDEFWAGQWTADIKIVRDKSIDEYKRMGRDFIISFYETYFPFDQFEIVGLETDDRYVLIDGNNYYVRIDKLARDATGTYYVCDYKTNNKMKSVHELQRDRQLAMYALWVRSKYPDAKDVKLIWYFLAHKQRIVVEHSKENLLSIESSAVTIIKQIQGCEDFVASSSKLCDWCEYKAICPAWNPGSLLTSKVARQQPTAAVSKPVDSPESVPLAIASDVKKPTRQATLDLF